MTQIPPGWYPDPAPAQLGQAQGQRYWDGQQWTEHITPGAPVQTAPYPTAYPATYQVAGVATTPDGQPLAGWWARVGAYLLDGLFVLVATIALSFPWMAKIFRAAFDAAERAGQAAQNGQPGPFVPPDVAGQAVAVTIIGLVVSIVYNVGFLRWKAATPGKMALGLRVRLRETPGQLSWGTCLARWGAQDGIVTVLRLVPFVSVIGSLYFLLDSLWPLWDSKKQAIHDQVARTNVVKVR